MTESIKESNETLDELGNNLVELSPLIDKATQPVIAMFFKIREVYDEVVKEKFDGKENNPKLTQTFLDLCSAISQIQMQLLQEFN
ncbi:MAG: hypothetical protein HYZ42_03745 [Bacteroidetes bacterium]|nr:hypothetical protein [Bacteroidota bacterium]